MLQSPAFALRSKVACISMVPGIADARPNVAQLFDRLHDRKATRSSLLDRYRKGWSEANPDKILDATGPGYRFRDPFVGSFSRRSLHKYFDLLHDRLSRGGTIRRPDIAFFLSGPMDRPSHPSELRFWREAPRIGLTGVTRIKVGERGVIAESVTYDLNLASDILCRGLRLPSATSVVRPPAPQPLTAAASPPSAMPAAAPPERSTHHGTETPKLKLQPILGQHNPPTLREMVR